MSRPREVDIAARETREKLELAAARGDGALALEGAHLVVQHGLTVCAADFVAPASDSQNGVGWTDSTGNDASPGFGQPFAARYAGRCALCDQRIAPGEYVVCRSADRAVAHAACARGGR